MQLVQLQQAQDRFKQHGIGLAAISYDSDAILKDFAQRQQITFPLLADPQSQVIRQYNVLNTSAKGMTAGMAHPGFVYIDANGRMKEQFFEAAYTDRYTPNNLIGKLFPELAAESGKNMNAPHLDLNLRQSDEVAVPGSRVTLIAELRLPSKMHVYAPGCSGYKRIELNLESAKEIKLHDTAFPQPKI